MATQISTLDYVPLWTVVSQYGIREHKLLTLIVAGQVKAVTLPDGKALYCLGDIKKYVASLPSKPILRPRKPRKGKA
jgi:hypothetical protein